ncbi:MAG: heavy-metal-associated domain-containing protein [Ignavibacteriae bacterium]|nr:heavy-metal-associated domain-containing protein [Ignavibacteriota bacterium]
MKRYVSLVALVILAMQLVFAGDEPKQCTINVKGMTCGSCVNRVKSAVRSLDGVQTINVSLEKGIAEVSYIPAKLSENDLIASIEKTGFSASLAEPSQEKKGKAEMEMPSSAEFDEARAKLQTGKEKLAKDGKYSCCISPSCNFCAIAMNMCPCGMNVTKGEPVCGECKGGWMAGYGAIPDIKPENVKMMPPDKAKMGYEMRAKMMKMTKEMKEKK